MKKFLILCFAACLLVTFSGFPSQATLSSTFDSSDEGWTGSYSEAFSWNSEGYISINIGFSIDSYHFFPPSSWIGEGDWSKYINGIFEFDFKWYEVYQTLSLFIVKNGGGQVVYDKNLQNYSGDWTHIKFSLDSPDYVSPDYTVEEIFQDIGQVAITGRFRSLFDGVVYLDNVQLTPIPLPPSVLLLGSGLLGLGIIGWRRKSS